MNIKYYENLFPMCGYTLRKRYEGLVCKNHQCKLYHKLNYGWVKLTNTSKWSNQRIQINGFYNSNYRLFIAKEFAQIRKQVLRRDNYTCKKCNTFQLGQGFSPPISVHHIVPVTEEMAMYLDKHNLITLCDKCHKEIHSLDKQKFGKVWA